MVSFQFNALCCFTVFENLKVWITQARTNVYRVTHYLYQFCDRINAESVKLCSMSVMQETSDYMNLCNHLIVTNRVFN